MRKSFLTLTSALGVVVVGFGPLTASAGADVKRRHIGDTPTTVLHLRWDDGKPVLEGIDSSGKPFNPNQVVFDLAKKKALNPRDPDGDENLLTLPEFDDSGKGDISWVGKPGEVFPAAMHFDGKDKEAWKSSFDEVPDSVDPDSILLRMVEVTGPSWVEVFTYRPGYAYTKRIFSSTHPWYQNFPMDPKVAEEPNWVFGKPGDYTISLAVQAKTKSGEKLASNTITQRWHVTAGSEEPKPEPKPTPTPSEPSDKPSPKPTTPSTPKPSPDEPTQKPSPRPSEPSSKPTSPKPSPSTPSTPRRPDDSGDAPAPDPGSSDGGGSAPGGGDAPVDISGGDGPAVPAPGGGSDTGMVPGAAPTSGDSPVSGGDEGSLPGVSGGDAGGDVGMDSSGGGAGGDSGSDVARSDAGGSVGPTVELGSSESGTAPSGDGGGNSDSGLSVTGTPVDDVPEATSDVPADAGDGSGGEVAAPPVTLDGNAGDTSSGNGVTPVDEDAERPTAVKAAGLTGGTLAAVVAMLTGSSALAGLLVARRQRMRAAAAGASPDADTKSDATDASAESTPHDSGLDV